jgi:nucleotide-binding universal stress UspA family protein
MTIQSILAVTDLSPRENVAVQRAWHLADAHRATVKLMYLPRPGQAVPADAAARLVNAARQLEESLELRVRTAPLKAQRVEDLAAEARGMDLVVLPHRHERSTGAFFRGQPVQRLLRHCACPLLVARSAPAGRYRHVLVAVDFSPASEALVKLAADFDSAAELVLFHAIGTRDEAKLRMAEATEQAIRAYRRQCLLHVQERMVALTDTFGDRRDRLLTAIDHGDPARQTVMQQERSGADLVVLGHRRTSAWEDFLYGSVAHRVLTWGASDVLVVPHAWVQATAPIAARRMNKHPLPPALPMARGRRSPS